MTKVYLYFFELSSYISFDWVFVLPLDQKMMVMIKMHAAQCDYDVYSAHFCVCMYFFEVSFCIFLNCVFVFPADEKMMVMIKMHAARCDHNV